MAAEVPVKIDLKTSTIRYIRAEMGERKACTQRDLQICIADVHTEVETQRHTDTANMVSCYSPLRKSMMIF